MAIGGVPFPEARPAIAGTGQGMVSVAGRKAVVVVLGLRARGTTPASFLGQSRSRGQSAQPVCSDASFPLRTVSGRRSADGRTAGDAQGMSDASHRSAPVMGRPRLRRFAVSGRRSRMQRQHLRRRTIWSGGAMPVRRPWNRVAPFIASGAPPRCAVRRFLQLLREARHPAFSLKVTWARLGPDHQRVGASGNRSADGCSGNP